MKLKSCMGILLALIILPVSASAMDGKALFKSNCLQCHSIDGTASTYGKTLEPFPARNLAAIADTVGRDEMRRIITHGINDTAMSPKKYSLDGLEIEAVIDYIQTFEYKANLANGAKRFGSVCVSCHGADGRARTGMGAKNLVYSNKTLEEIVHTMRYGVPGTQMTGKRHQLNNADIADVAQYVHGLRYMSNPANGKKLFGSNCLSCHSSPTAIKFIGNAASTPSIVDLSDLLLELRIRHGSHVKKAGAGISKLSADEIQDIMAYMRK